MNNKTQITTLPSYTFQLLTVQLVLFDRSTLGYAIHIGDLSVA